MARISTRPEGADEKWVENEKRDTRFDNRALIGSVIGVWIFVLIIYLVIKYITS